MAADDQAAGAATAAGSGLRRKVGPFTVAGWAGIGAAGIGLGLLIRRAGFFTAGPAPADLPTDDGGTYDPGMPGYKPVGGSAPTGPAVVTGGPERPTTNDQWMRYAVEGLSAGADNISPTTSQPALALFLEGQEVTQQQADVVGLAIRRFGAPPEGAPPLRVRGAGTPDDWRSMTTAQLLVMGRNSYAAGMEGDGSWTRIAEEVYARIMAGEGVNVLDNRQPFDIYVLSRVIERHPQLVPTPENVRGPGGTGTASVANPTSLRRT